MRGNTRKGAEKKGPVGSKKNEIWFALSQVKKVIKEGVVEDLSNKQGFNHDVIP